jgi:putative Mn2+ efflux pump MntP
MNFAATAALSLAMSTDAFAASIAKGASLHRPALREALRTGLIFGVIEGLTPVVGWLLGKLASPYVAAWDHWIAFILLGVLGVRMVMAGFRASDAEEEKGFWVQWNGKPG